MYEKQVARLLADPRSEALSTRFARQWLRLGDVDAVLPDAVAYPYFDRTLGDAFIKESELFFDSLVREDRSVLDLLTADYTFVNERIARHYGIPNVTGNAFRRVTLPAERRGILTHGSVLVLTSVADRTSPVMRGKWVMEVMMGSPPPRAAARRADRSKRPRASWRASVLTVRERMEEHRKNPQCTSCHRVIDPLGLALENFDVTGKYRIKDAGMPVDPSGVLYDGTPMSGPAGLRAALLEAPGRGPAQLHRAPDDLRARPPRRRQRHVGGAPHHPRCGKAQLEDLVVRAGRGHQPVVYHGPWSRAVNDRRRPIGDKRLICISSPGNISIDARSSRASAPPWRCRSSMR